MTTNLKIEFNSLDEVSERIQHIQEMIKTLKSERERQLKEIEKQIEKLEAEESILRNLFNYWKENYQFVRK